MKLHSSGVIKRPGGRDQPHPSLEAAALTPYEPDANSIWITVSHRMRQALRGVSSVPGNIECPLEIC